jgi:glycine/D-amino acid oxidase-like deaminating enzyme
MSHIAVIGAGVIGAATADQLCGAGARVTLLDARQPGNGASGTSLAWLNSNAKEPRAYHDLSVSGIEEWRRLAGDLGSPSWYAATGSIAWAGTDDGRADLAARVARLQDWGYPASDLTAAGLADLEPHLRLPAHAHAAFFPAEGFLYGGPATQTLVARARSAGADVVTGSPVRSVDAEGAAVTGVVLADGRRITADAYVFCAGAATPGLLAGLGVTVPLLPADAARSPAPCLVAHVATGAHLIRRVIQSADLSMRPLQSPGLYLEAGDLNATVDVHIGPELVDRHVAELRTRAMAVLPDLTDGKAETDGRICVRPLPVDGLPI